jgi:hypothetical protein
MESVDDLNILDVGDSVPGIAETFDITAKTLIMSLLDSLEGLSSRWTLVRALKVSNKHGTQLVPGLDGCFRKVDEP